MKRVFGCGGGFHGDVVADEQVWWRRVENIRRRCHGGRRCWKLQ